MATRVLLSWGSLDFSVWARSCAAGWSAAAASRSRRMLLGGGLLLGGKSASAAVASGLRATRVSASLSASLLGGLATRGGLLPRPRGAATARSSLPLSLDDGLLALGLGLRCALLLGAASPFGLAELAISLLALRVGDGLVCEGGLAVAGFGLLELPLLHQVVLAAHGAGHFLGLAREAVETAPRGPVLALSLLMPRCAPLVPADTRPQL